MTESAYSDRRTHHDRDHFPEALDACGRELERLLTERASPDALRAPVLAYVRAARTVGAPPERALAAFKKMLRSVHEIESLVLTERAELANSLVQSMIEAYYNGELPRRFTAAP